MMGYVPKMANLTRTERRVRADYQTRLKDWHSSGRPSSDLSSYKLEFGAELLMTNPPTVIAESSTTCQGGRSLTTHAGRSSDRDRSMRRRAFHVTDLATPDVCVPLLTSDDVTIRACNGDFGAAGKWQPLARHADCHEIYFVHRAQHPLSLMTDFGLLEEAREGRQ